MYRYLLSSAAIGALIAATPASAQQATPGQQGAQSSAQTQSYTIQTTPTSQARDAQQQQQRAGAAGQTQGSAQRQVAQQCMNDLQAFSRKMDADGFWLTGYGGRWGYGVARQPVATPPPAAAGGTAATGQATMSGTPTGTAAAIDRGPLGAAAGYGMTAPRYQIRTLYQASNVLAHRGDEQGCQAVMAELRDVYNQHIQTLRTAGVEPGQVTSWRQERIVAAKPVTDMNVGMLSLDDVTGTEVRNAKDERLGSINDVVLDPKNGNVSHVIVARGGFLGFGRDYVAVPWSNLKATPGLNTFVLNVSEDTLEKAPKVDPDTFANPSAYERNRQQVDAYWQQQRAG